MVEAGIIDPAKVTRSALQNATSVTSSFLTTEAVVAELPSSSYTDPVWVAWAVTCNKVTACHNEF